MKKWMIPAIHLLLWTLLLISNSYDLYSSHDDYINKAVQASGLNKILFVYIFNFSYIIVFLVAFYGAYFLVGPYLFIRKKYAKAFGYLILVLIAMVITRYLIEFHIILPYLKFHNYFGHSVELAYYIKNCIFFTYKYCLLGLVAYFLIASNRIEKEKKELEKEKVQAELLFLKSQINPHFLFNTINDIYSLTYRKDDQAPVALLKLSSLLRYILYNENSPKIILTKELSYIEDYMELVRIGNKGMVYIDYQVDVVDAEHSIEPLLLIPIIENIFKHGVIDDPSRPAYIHIQLKENQFKIKCSNYVKKQYKDQTGGIGLKNVKRRLELLYPETHRFIVQQKENTFNCSLEVLL
jgi:two-component system LytT family sensor kinase